MVVEPWVSYLMKNGLNPLLQPLWIQPLFGASAREAVWILHSGGLEIWSTKRSQSSHSRDFPLPWKESRLGLPEGLIAELDVRFSGQGVVYACQIVSKVTGVSACSELEANQSTYRAAGGVVCPKWMQTRTRSSGRSAHFCSCIQFHRSRWPFPGKYRPVSNTSAIGSKVFFFLDSCTIPLSLRPTI
jgi:hypothetical protein